MKKTILTSLTLSILLLSGCTPKTVDFMESMQIEGQHEKALKFLGEDKGALVYKATPKAKQCLKDKINARGYWMLQDEIDCWDNELK